MHCILLTIHTAYYQTSIMLVTIGATGEYESSPTMQESSYSTRLTQRCLYLHIGHI